MDESTCHVSTNKECEHTQFIRTNDSQGDMVSENNRSFKLICIFLFSLEVAFITAKCPHGTFGHNCQFACHCSNDDECDELGNCPGECENPWSGEKCQRKNMAYGCYTAQKDGKGSINSSLGVDSNPLTCARSRSDSPGWWMVDLQKVTSVLRFHIITDNTTSLFDWQILIGESPMMVYMRQCTMLKVHNKQATVTCETSSSRELPARYVVVNNRNGPVVICELQVIVCSDLRYGENCEHECQCLDSDEQCHPLYGLCTSGCMVGRTGANCQDVCYMSYGRECMFECGQCSNKTACDPFTGECHEGCAPGWRGSRCDIMCPAGLYGQECFHECGHCRDGQVCEPWDGKCLKGCAAGWTGDHCDVECPGGKHGENCQFQCGHCALGASCNKISGICEAGCREGWRGRFCTLGCLLGTYGPNCEKTCPRCKDKTCDIYTGTCLYECIQGYMGKLCDTPCLYGTYGENCRHVCGQCLDGEHCRSTDGYCLNGCQPGFNGTRCRDVCPDGFYGSGCMPCGYCYQGEPCDKNSGRCFGKCAAGFDGDLCQNEEQFMELTSQHLGTVLGVGVAAVLLPTVFVLICLCIKWRDEETYPYHHMWLDE